MLKTLVCFAMMTIGCAAHIGTGTDGNCQEIVDALTELATRCGGGNVQPNYCSDRLLVYVTAAQADECRRWAESVSCADAHEAVATNTRPKACIIGGL